ncbi:MAG: M2 family metallopeptidase [Blastocatellia bacterium]|nr:M2 family metallopeptidase [Blastocatellia bacterium]
MRSRLSGLRPPLPRDSADRASSPPNFTKADLAR